MPTDAVKAQIADESFIVGRIRFLQALTRNFADRTTKENGKKKKLGKPSLEIYFPVGMKISPLS